MKHVLVALLAWTTPTSSLSMTSVSGDSSASPRIRERLKEHPQLSSLFRSEVANYGICTGKLLT